MFTAKDALEKLAQQEGVDLAMVVSRDGFILEMETARPLELEPETVGAAVSTFWSTADSMGDELRSGQGRNSVVQFKNAVISTSLMEENDLILTVVGDKNVNLATVRFLTVKFSHLLEQVL